MAEPKEAQAFQRIGLNLTDDDGQAHRFESLAVRMARYRAMQAAQEAEAELLDWMEDEPGSNADAARSSVAVDLVRLLAALAVASLLAWLLGPFSPLAITAGMGLAIFAGLALTGLVLGLVSTHRS